MIQWCAEENGHVARFCTKKDRDTWVGGAPSTRHKLSAREVHQGYSGRIRGNAGGKYDDCSCFGRK